MVVNEGSKEDTFVIRLIAICNTRIFLPVTQFCFKDADDRTNSSQLDVKQVREK